MRFLKRFFKRTSYLMYYLVKMDWPKFWSQFNHARKISKKYSVTLFADAVFSVYHYNIGLIDYFYFKFFEKPKKERKTWMGTGYKYEYDLIMNPPNERHVLENKIHFLEAYAPFIKHAFCRLEDLNPVNEIGKKVLYNKSGKIVVKDALGQCGWGVEILNATDFTPDDLVKYMISKGFNLAEEFIVQHPDLNKLSDSGLNTVRIISQINKSGGVNIIGTTLRITVDSPVDNMALGNIAAPIDLETGMIIGEGAYQEIQKRSVNKHPITGVQLLGFQVPFWSEVLNLVKQAALHNTKNRSIGWDVAITPKGPSFVEGNHNWCKLLWQLPVNNGLKPILEDYKNGVK